MASPLNHRIRLLLAVCCLYPAAARAAEAPERTVAMDYGPFLSTSVIRPRPAAGARAAKGPDLNPDIVAHKGIAVPVGRGDAPAARATIVFDTDTLAYAAGWTGGFVNLSGTMLTNHKGTDYPRIQGDEAFHVAGPGWAKGDDFTDPRPGGLGQLGPDRRYKGLYANGDRVVFNYRIGDSDVLDMPVYEPSVRAFTRTIRVDRSGGEQSVALFDAAGANVMSVHQLKPLGDEARDAAAPADDRHVVKATRGDSITAASLVGPSKGAHLTVLNNRVLMSVPPVREPTIFRVAIWNGPPSGVDKFTNWAWSAGPPTDPKTLTSAGPAHWPEPIPTAGKLGQPGKSDGAYVADELTLPDRNPWNAWMRITGLDILPDGRAAVCTLDGDVWVCSGINDSLAKLSWRRYAAGLYHPMGLRVVNGDVYVCGRDQITRLHDLNGDGEADFYEDFNSSTVLHPLYHAFTMDLQTDAAGNFYYARCGRSVPGNYPDDNALFKVSPDGAKVEQIAWGLRAANGIGTGAGGMLLVSDNEGEWVPSSKISRVKGGEFLGSPPAQYRGEFPKDFTHPLCWIPKKLDTSSGGLAYIPDDRWGPYKGQWVHTSFGTASMFLLLTDEVDGQSQGAVIKLPLAFSTGIMRPRFNAKDGQLYVAGIGGGWQTSGTADGGVYRVRHIGKPAHAPSAFHVVPGGVRLTFPTPLDRASAADDQNWAVEQWNYKWTEKYGSPDYSVKNHAKAGHDAVDIKAVNVSDDGKTVTLQIPALAPVMQMMIQFNLKAADGTPVESELYATINKVPGGGK